MKRKDITKAGGGIGRELVGASGILRAIVGTAGAIFTIWALGWSWWVLAVITLAYIAYALLRRVVHLEGLLREAEDAATSLERRMEDAAAARERLDVAIVLAEGQPPLTTVALDEEMLDEWVANEAKRFPPVPTPSPAQQIRNSVFKVPDVFNQIEEEKRTPEQYRDQVQQYLKAARAVLPRALHVDLVEAGVGKLRLVVENHSDDNYEDLAVELRLEGDVWAYFDLDEAEEGVRFPAEPRRWGPRKVDLFSPLMARPAIPSLGFISRRGEIKNDQSSQITFGSVSIRPRRSADLEDVHLFVGYAGEATELRATWTATAKNRSGEARGDIVIPLAGPLTPLQLEGLSGRDDDA